MLSQVCVVHKGRPVAGIINEVFAKDEAAVWGVTLGEGGDGFKVCGWGCTRLCIWASECETPTRPPFLPLSPPQT